MRIDYNHIGKQYPFTSYNDIKSYDLNKILKDTESIIDKYSIVSICSLGYICGDATLLKDIQREQWLTQDLSNRLNKLESQNKISLTSEELAQKLRVLLKEEIKDYIQNYTKVGILLSGGMDSRILAGLLKEIIDEEKPKIEIVVYNWGLASSRDVIYAEEIAKRFNWDYQHLTLNSEQLKNNFYNNIEIGCEVSPLHLHCMKTVAEDTNSEVILAGTYGDSIGRGNFSGINVKDLNEKRALINNNLDLFKDDFFKEAKSHLKKRRKNYKIHLKTESYEYDFYANYLRRMLATPMSLIQQEKPLFQIFTSPSVYELMLGLSDEFRNDNVYKIIIQSLPGNIGYIPYAKNGKVFFEDGGEALDDYYMNSHKYGKWLREDLKDFIDDNLDYELLYSLKIFKPGSIERLYKLWLLSTNESNTKIDEVISYLSNLCIFIKAYDVRNIEENYVGDKKSEYLYLKNYLYIKLRNIKRV